jgi:cytochrome c-type biogenesis protein CcmH
MKRWWSILLLALAVQCGVGAFAKEAAPLAVDEAVEKRLVAITEELRCLVCQNESIAGSQADLANDLRREVREMIRAGKTDREILDFMVARYGDFVRYRPPVRPTTWLLWGGPFLLLLGGVGALLLFLRRRNRLTATAAPALTEEQRRAAAALLDNPKQS